ncbi:hypothetical protein [Burkholderia sp. IMCC1007]|uniref:hypothetical protein n=1 Tax=Burkholderia sp. IMCC1007 TaxID=3004104 RepID=UPI0022B50401|nr:hypothetical protein [Burkholderia sp. IMCC1007]
MPENKPTFAHRTAWERAGIERHHKIFFVGALRQHQLAIDHALSSKRRLDPDESDHVSNARGANLRIRPMRLTPHPRGHLLAEFALALIRPRFPSIVFVALCMTAPIAHVAHNTRFSHVTWPKD